MANMVISIHHNTATSKHIQEAVRPAGAEACPIFGIQLPPRPPLNPKVSARLVQPLIHCVPVTPPDRSQVEMAERRHMPNLAPALDLYLVRELEVIRQLLLRMPEL